MRHKWADLIIDWAEGAEIEIKTRDGKWEKTIPSWNEYLEYRIKPKEPEWWENIPEHGVLCWVSDIDESTRNVIDRITVKNDGWRYITPLTNEEIEAFKR